MRLSQLTRIHTGLLNRNEGLRDESLIFFERPQCSLLACRIAIEREDHVPTHLIVVHQ